MFLLYNLFVKLDTIVFLNVSFCDYIQTDMFV